MLKILHFLRGYNFFFNYNIYFGGGGGGVRAQVLQFYHLLYNGENVNCFFDNQLWIFCDFNWSTMGSFTYIIYGYLVEAKLFIVWIQKYSKISHRQLILSIYCYFVFNNENFLKFYSQTLVLKITYRLF